MQAVADVSALGDHVCVHLGEHVQEVVLAALGHLEPLRPRLTDEQHERLVSSLAVVLGWEAMIVLRDVRGLDTAQEEAAMRWAARALVEAMISEAGSAR